MPGGEEWVRLYLHYISSCFVCEYVFDVLVFGECFRSVCKLTDCKMSLAGWQEMESGDDGIFFMSKMRICFHGLMCLICDDDADW